jgi:hypothetical protein
VLQPGFLESLTGIRPDLCVTAAYGNILPRAFLEIPKRGTLNIHPSLLPKYRGAAPVQRAIQVSATAVLSTRQMSIHHSVQQNGKTPPTSSPFEVAFHSSMPTGSNIHPAYLTGRAEKGTWGNLGRQKEMISIKSIVYDGSKLVPTIDVKLTLPYLSLVPFSCY